MDYSFLSRVSLLSISMKFPNWFNNILIFWGRTCPFIGFKEKNRSSSRSFPDCENPCLFEKSEWQTGQVTVFCYWSQSDEFLKLLILLLERSVNNSHENVFVQSLKLWGLQEYIKYFGEFLSLGLFRGHIYITAEVETGCEGKSEIQSGTYRNIRPL